MISYAIIGNHECLANIFYHILIFLVAILAQLSFLFCFKFVCLVHTLLAFLCLEIMHSTARGRQLVNSDPDWCKFPLQAPRSRIILSSPMAGILSGVRSCLERGCDVVADNVLEIDGHCREVCRNMPLAEHAIFGFGKTDGDFLKAELRYLNHTDAGIYGPPCQSVSAAGKGLGGDDPRWELYERTLAHVIEQANREPRDKFKWFAIECGMGIYQHLKGKAPLAGHIREKLELGLPKGWVVKLKLSLETPPPERDNA